MSSRYGFWTLIYFIPRIPWRPPSQLSRQTFFCFTKETYWFIYNCALWPENVGKNRLYFVGKILLDSKFPIINLEKCLRWLKTISLKIVRVFVVDFQISTYSEFRKILIDTGVIGIYTNETVLFWKYKIS